jgi:glycosyltransferase involved in cell wall biosynthesis
LTPARFTAQKGHDVLVDTIPAVVNAVPDARFVWIGRGPERDDVMAEVTQRGLAAHVELREPGPDLLDAYAEASAIVLPSRFEGLPLVVLEAMALRIPIVATRVCGTVEAIDDSVAWLVPPEDPGALAAAVLRVLGDGDEVAARAERASQRWRAEFRTSRMVADTEAVYASLPAQTRR